jgi:hypothetical protein
MLLQNCHIRDVIFIISMLSSGITLNGNHYFYTVQYQGDWYTVHNIPYFIWITSIDSTITTPDSTQEESLLLKSSISNNNDELKLNRRSDAITATNITTAADATCIFGRT